MIRPSILRDGLLGPLQSACPDSAIVMRKQLSMLGTEAQRF